MPFTQHHTVRSAASKESWGTSHQLSGQMICLAEYTRQGSAWLGEFKILREYSFEEAMTIKLGILFKRRAEFKVDCTTHMWNTESAESGKRHCFMYPSIVGFNESANLPIIGIVHLSPGR